MRAFDNFFKLFRKADQAMSSAESMQRTVQRAEYQAQNVSGANAGGKTWKWIILTVILVIAVLYFIFG